MNYTGTLKSIQLNIETQRPILEFEINEKEITRLEELKGSKLNLVVNKDISKRSMNANNYFWKLLEELCDLLELNKIEEYKRRVKELGIFRVFKIEEQNVDTFRKIWEQQGIAWFVEILDTDRDVKIINAYYGSSSFNKKQMARLINDLVQDCIALGIPTKSEAEINSLLKELKWNLSYKNIHTAIYVAE